MSAKPPVADRTHPTLTASARSEALRRRAHETIPGGAHTYAKGDDQYPEGAPAFIVRGEGCRVWDLDGREFLEYGMGLRSVTLGHAYPAVVEAAAAAIKQGVNFTRPSPLELEAAERLLGLVEGADMAKFAKNGSDVTTAAVKLARAHTGRDLVAICRDQPFFSTDDWFIGTTAMPAGIPQSIRTMTLSFRYNDLDSVDTLFRRYRGQIAGLVLEPAAAQEPAPGFLEGLRARCDAEGAVLIFDEMITGFRWHRGGAQTLYGVVPDLSAFGKAIANGFSVSALVGKRELMELGGLRHDKERVFLLSTTHGAETHALAAAIATMKVYENEGVVEFLHRQGARLRAGIDEAVRRRGLTAQFQLAGRDCNLVYAAKDAEGKPSQAFRTLVLQEALKRGILMPSLVVSYSHGDDEIDRTVDAFGEVLVVYRQALDGGIERFLEGRPVQPVFRPPQLTNAGMLRLEIHRRPKEPLRILCLGAHSDDIEIGCGGTLLHLLEGRVEIDWVVFSGSPLRAREARKSARGLTKGTRSLRIATKRFRDGFFPTQTVRIKEEFERLKRRPSPDIVFSPWRGDAHQDHRLLAELTSNTFRDHLILEYEIPKYDGDLGSPNLYVPLAEKTARRKVEHLMAGFPSQAGNQWFDREAFWSILRLRGIESNSPSRFAEGFYCRKAALL